MKDKQLLRQMAKRAKSVNRDLAKKAKQKGITLEQAQEEFLEELRLAGFPVDESEQVI